MPHMRSDSRLKAELTRLKALDDAQARGYGLELLVGSMFQRAHFETTRNPGTGGSRQVDLMASMGHQRYLLEMKWRKKPVDVSAVDTLRQRLRKSSQPILGLLVSYSGFTAGAVADVEAEPQHPILLLTGAEIERLVSTELDLVRLLQQKENMMRVHGRALLDPATRRITRSIDKGVLPDSPERFVTGDGVSGSSVCCSGEFGPFAYVRELPDIDWGAASGNGVVLDIEAGSRDQASLADLLHDLTALGWVSGASCWSIQQAETNWHGSGATQFVEALADWKARYEGSSTIHHTEEFSFVDQIDDIGFYTLTGQISADQRRIVWRSSLSLQLSGIPVDTAPLQVLCEKLDNPSNLVFRPRSEPSVARRRLALADAPVLDIIGYVVERPDALDPSDDEEWATGVIALNPFRDSSSGDAAAPDWWPDVANRSETIICALRSSHPLSQPRKVYRLWSCESAWTSDAVVVRPLADWDDDRKQPPTRPRAT